MRRKRRNNQRLHHKGGALISALFITALAAIIATALAVEERLLIHEGELTMHADQGYLALQGMQDSAKVIVTRYALQWGQAPQGQPSQQTPVAQQVMPLQMQMSPVVMQGLSMSGGIDIAQGRFNLNDLVYSANQPNFIALLLSVAPRLSKQQALGIAQSLTAWMTTGADNRYYASLHPPYSSSKNQFVSISELRLIAGMTPDLYVALAPYVTALPVATAATSTTPPPQQQTPPPQQQTPSPQPQQPTAQLTPIDINETTAPVLMAVNPGLNLSQAASIVACQKQHGAFASTQEFLSLCAQPSGVANLSNITAQSQYFLVYTKTMANNSVVSLNSLLVTEVGKNNTLKVSTVWQSFE